jgi:hypothetical protein
MEWCGVEVVMKEERKSSELHALFIIAVLVASKSRNMRNLPMCFRNPIARTWDRSVKKQYKKERRDRPSSIIPWMEYFLVASKLKSKNIEDESIVFDKLHNCDMSCIFRVKEKEKKRRRGRPSAESHVLTGSLFLVESENIVTHVWIFGNNKANDGIEVWRRKNGGESLGEWIFIP